MRNVSRKLVVNLSLKKFSEPKTRLFFNKPADVGKIRLRDQLMCIAARRQS